MSIDNLDLSIRNPKLDREFHITVPSSATVRDLKYALQTQYPGNPLPESLTIIYAGRVLRTDHTILTNVLSNPPYILHLVVADQAPSPSIVKEQQPAPSAPVAKDNNNKDTTVGTEGNDAGATTTNNNSSRAVNNNEPEQFRDGALTSDDEDNDEEGCWLPMRGDTTQQATTATTASTTPIQQKDKEPETRGGDPAATTSTATATPPVPQQGDDDALHSDPTFIAAYHAALQSLSGQQTPSPSPSPSPSMWVPVQMYPPQQTSPMMMMMMPPSPYQYPSPSPYTMPGDMASGGQYYYPPHNVPMMNMMMPQPQQPGVDPSMNGMRRRRSSSSGGAGGGGPSSSSSSNQQRMVPLHAVIAMLTAAEREGPLPLSLSRILRSYQSTSSSSSSSRQQIQRVPRRGGIFQRPFLRQFHLRINVNVRSLLQLMVLMVVVYQHCPPKRFAMLVVLGIALFLTGTDRVRHVLNRLAGIVQPPQRNVNNPPVVVEQRVQPPQQQGEGIAPADHQQQQQNPVPETPEGQQRQEGGNAAAPAAAAQQQQQQQQQPAPLEVQGQGPGQFGILRELQALVVGFLTSLLPGFNVNPEDARAIAAAQEAFQDQAQDVRAM